MHKCPCYRTCRRWYNMQGNTASAWQLYGLNTVRAVCCWRVRGAGVDKLHRLQRGMSRARCMWGVWDADATKCEEGREAHHIPEQLRVLDLPVADRCGCSLLKCAMAPYAMRCIIASARWRIRQIIANQAKCALYTESRDV